MSTQPIIPEWTRADRLRKAREHAGLTQAEMSEALLQHGIAASRSTVSAWERGENKPVQGGHDIASLCEAWAEITGVSREWLLYAAWDSNPQPTDSRSEQLVPEGWVPDAERPTG